jgi:hypothetical protein
MFTPLHILAAWSVHAPASCPRVLAEVDETGGLQSEAGDGWIEQGRLLPDAGPTTPSRLASHLFAPTMTVKGTGERGPRTGGGVRLGRLRYPGGGWGEDRRWSGSPESRPTTAE